MSEMTILSERKMTHADYRNARLIAQLLVVARCLQRASRGNVGPAVLDLIHDSVAVFGDGQTLRIETYELARAMGIEITEADASQVSNAVN